MYRVYTMYKPCTGYIPCNIPCLRYTICIGYTICKGYIQCIELILWIGYIYVECFYYNIYPIHGIYYIPCISRTKEKLGYWSWVQKQK